MNASYRREGTNQFGRARTIRYIPTWNVGGNWSIDQESFFPKLKPLSSLSMSLSYGMSGTIPYVHNALPRLKTLLPFFGDANLIEPGVYIDEPANYDLTYEKMYELNWGLNFGLFDERISQVSPSSIVRVVTSSTRYSLRVLVASSTSSMGTSLR